MHREWFLEGVAFIEVDIEVPGDEVVGQFGVESPREEVAIALRVKGYEHGVTCSGKDQLVVAGDCGLL